MLLRSEYLKPVVGYIKSLDSADEASSLPTNGDVLRCYLYHTERNIPKKGENRIKICRIPKHNFIEFSSIQIILFIFWKPGTGIRI